MIFSNRRRVTVGKLQYIKVLSIPAVHNLGYAHPQGYVRNLKGYAKLHQFKIYSKILIENVLNCL